MCKSHCFLLLAAACFLLMTSGCGGGDYPETVEVNGRVTLDGEPLPNAIVTFMPTDGQRTASGTTNAQGEFSLSTFEPGDGAVPGEHKVAVMPKEPPPMPGSSSPGDTGEEKSENYTPPFPARYGQPGTSGLTATVSADQENDFILELESK